MAELNNGTKGKPYHFLQVEVHWLVLTVFLNDLVFEQSDFPVDFLSTFVALVFKLHVCFKGFLSESFSFLALEFEF